MHCPRCHRESAAGDTSCVACGAPLLFGDEPAPAPLDRVLDLDRRLGGFAGAAAGSMVIEERPDEPATGAAFGPDERVTWSAGPDQDAGVAVPGAPPCEPVVQVDARAIVPPGQPVPIARRVGAAALDAALVASLAAVPLLLAARALPIERAFEALFPACAAFVALLGFTYAVLGHTLMGATVGKRLLGLRVTGPDGTAPGLARSAARAAVALLGTAGLGIGVLVGLFTRSGRSLHDVVAGTSVVRVVDPSQRGA